MNLANVQTHCRICLQNGDVNIWDCKVAFNTEAYKDIDAAIKEDPMEVSFVQLMDVFNNTEQDLFNLTEEFSLLCFACLEDLKFCYIIYEKIKLANQQLKYIYEESLNQCTEEEHLLEAVEEKQTLESNDTHLKETIPVEKTIDLSTSNINTTEELQEPNKTNHSNKIVLDQNDAFIITQFISSTLEPNELQLPTQIKDDGEECQHPHHYLTVNLKAVEVKDISNLKNSETPLQLGLDTEEAAVYICQYCPQAFAKSDYLKTHIHKSHVCKFCTQPFSLTEDLFKHIRELHNEHKCAICQKLFSSSTNLRHHIRRRHHIQLPAKVTLLDFIKSSSMEENLQDDEVEILQEEFETANIVFNTEYIWKNDDCIDML